VTADDPAAKPPTDEPPTAAGSALAASPAPPEPTAPRASALLGPAPPDLEARVIKVIAEALDRPPEEIFPYSSLVDDLGAESIDFMDIIFRLEDDLGIEIPDDDVWRGVFGPGQLTPEAIAAGVATLHERLPEFRWDRFPDGVRQQDLPRLATVSTILTYLAARYSRPGP
jgi:acyl carrier protein